MAQIVQQCRETDKPGVLGAELEYVAQQATHVKNAKGMLKPCVERTWIYEVGESQLPDPAKPLEDSSGYDVSLLAGQANESMDRISNGPWFAHTIKTFQDFIVRPV